MGQDDRRRIPRVPVFFVLERLNRPADEPGEESQGVVKNITPDGLLLESNVTMNKNDLIQVSFTLPQVNKTLNLEARVRWVENKKAFSSAGLEFLDLHAEDREAIMEYLINLGPCV
jgi:hypothetical protein